MKQYFESIGWLYAGDCGCRENKRIYTNPKFTNWQLWITSDGNFVEFRKVYGNPNDTQRKGRAGTANFKEAYEYWVINDRD